MPDQTWYQQQIFKPTVYEVNVRIGVIPEQDHAQILAEMKDPTTNVQIAMWSRPHTTIHGLGRAADEALRKIFQWLDQEVEPF